MPTPRERADAILAAWCADDDADLDFVEAATPRERQEMVRQLADEVRADALDEAARAVADTEVVTMGREWTRQDDGQATLAAAEAAVRALKGRQGR